MHSSPTEPVLVLIHPGSAVGSANYNLGEAAARDARDLLAQELAHWKGHVLVIDGALSDELERVPSLAHAIDECLARNRACGYLSLRLKGDDPEHLDRLGELCDSGFPFAARFVLTGAWYEPANGGGCVGSAATLLRARGFEALVDESALQIDVEDDCPSCEISRPA